jgi:sugar (pentulose or hexulose) kinase
MSEGLLLGLDVGTTFVKAAVVDVDGHELCHGRARTPWQTVPGGAEMDPHELSAAVFAACRAALEAAPRGRVLGVGVTSMAETGALLDSRGQPVATMIAWHDERGEAEAEELEVVFGAEGFSARTGLPVSRLCTLSKYRWMRAHLPDTVRGVRWLSVAEWVVRSLGGEESSELSLASRTGFLDLSTRRWWDDVLDWAEAPPGLLPEPREAGSPAGRVGHALPEAADAVLTVAGHDHSCAAVGAGATRLGDVFDSCGSAEAFVRGVEPPVPPSSVGRAVTGGVTVGWHVVPERQALMAGFVSGLALQLFLDLLGVEGEGREALDSDAANVGPGAEGITVHDVIADRVTLEGIPRSASPGHVWRAALEAVARHGADVLATIESVAGETERLVVTGGWARSPAVRAVKRAALGPFEEPSVEEAGARGAALMSGIAAGFFTGIEDLPPVPSSTS